MNCGLWALKRPRFVSPFTKRFASEILGPLTMSRPEAVPNRPGSPILRCGTAMQYTSASREAILMKARRCSSTLDINRVIRDPRSMVCCLRSVP